VSFERFPSSQFSRDSTIGLRAGITKAERRHSTKADTQLSTPPTKGAESKDKMASDEDYAAFLDKANADPNEGVAKTRTSNKVALKAVDHGVEIPAALTKATEDTFYVSDADEPFEPVCLKLGGKGKGIMPDEGLCSASSEQSCGLTKNIAVAFAKLVHHPSPEDADVTILDIGEWDPSGQYKDIVDATRAASKGSDVRVYRISAGGSRVEYYLVGIDGEKLVGVKALAVES
jgi:hypothetical protein